MTSHDWYMHGVITGLAIASIMISLHRRRARRAHNRTFPVHGGEVTITAYITEAEYEAIKACWQALYGRAGNAHEVQSHDPADIHSADHHQPKEQP